MGQIDIVGSVTVYTYYSNLSGMKGLITDKELPEMVKTWRKNGGLVWLKKPEYNIYVIAKKDMDESNWLPDEEEGWTELV